MVDIHAHIIPGIDDGSDSMEDSIKMARMAYGCGVRTIVATPHSNLKNDYDNYTGPELFQQIRELNRRIEQEGIRLSVYPGMEIYATEDVTEKIRQGRVISLNGSRYYLIEFPFDASAGWMEHILDEIFRLGQAVPVIAHPERYDWIQEQPERIYRWIMKGAMIQINKASLFGKFGMRAFRVVMDLMEHNLVTCVASDAHTPYSRTTFLGDAREFLSKEYSEEYADQVLRRNPGRMIENREILMRAGARSMEKRAVWND